MLSSHESDEVGEPTGTVDAEDHDSDEDSIYLTSKGNVSRFARAFAPGIRVYKDECALDENHNSRTVGGVRFGTMVDPRKPLALQRKVVWWCQSDPPTDELKSRFIPFNSTWAYVSVASFPF